MPRRARHEGTVYKRPDRSYWEGGVSLGGKRYWVTGKTRSEVVAKLRALVSRYQEGNLAPPSRLTVADWVAEYLADAEGRLKPKTLDTYRAELAALLPHLGRVRLVRLSPLHIQRALLELSAQGKGTRRLQLCWAALHACLERARRLGLLGSNPCDQVPKPAHQRREAREWGIEEMRRFLAEAAADPHPLSKMLGLALLTGMRVGELLGLEWGDVDWQDAVLRVRRSVVWASDGWHLGGPKSRAGERAITLPALALRLLEGLPRDSVHLFWRARPPRSRTISEAMATLCERAGVPRRPAHYLRHCHAALLAAQGLDIKTLQRRLGHAQASLTLDVYAHALSEMDRRAAELVDEALAT
ncbi:MAG: site-specific integrase [Dehalococcoidia bacterium]|nr:site-specific integrase [Dehalococcoidia bacterium]